MKFIVEGGAIAEEPRIDENLASRVRRRAKCVTDRVR